MKVFIDTSVFIALFIHSEQQHEKVAKKYQTYSRHRAQFVTSNLVVSELFTRLAYTTNHSVTKKVVKMIQQLSKTGELVIIHVDADWFDKTIPLFQKYLEHKLSFVDANICVLVKELQLDEIYTLDSDFKKVGLKTSF